MNSEREAQKSLLSHDRFGQRTDCQSRVQPSHPFFFLQNLISFSSQTRNRFDTSKFVAAMGAKKKQSKKPERDIDYAATADAFADRNSDEDVEDPEELEHSDDSGDESEKSEEDSEAEEQEAEEEVDEDESESEEEEEEEGDEQEEIPMSVPVSANGEQCTFDLRNLLAVNSHQLDTSQLYSRRTKKSPAETDITIPPEKMDIVVNEQYLLEKAADGCSQLIASLWQLPTEKSDVGPMVTLPSFDASNIPRELVSGSLQRLCTF